MFAFVICVPCVCVSVFVIMLNEEETIINGPICLLDISAVTLINDRNAARTSQQAFTIAHGTATAQHKHTPSGEDTTRDY